MEVQLATIVPGTETPAADGATGALRCILRAPDGVLVAAFLKRGDAAGSLIEAFCSVLLDGWGLPVPQCYLIEEADGLAFASVDVNYPNLKQRVSLAALPENSHEWKAALTVAAGLVCSLPSTPKACACDEAIDNRDRNLGNVLWDGSVEYWIDHAFAFGRALPDANKLAVIATAIGKADAVSSGAISAWTTMDRTAPDSASAALASYGDCSAWAKVATDRVNNLGMRILDRFPKPDDLLNQGPGAAV